MKLEQIHLRDPFIMPYVGKYYLYGTRGFECWDKGMGFDVYESEDLKEWSNPVPVFEPDENFKYKYHFWAPEVHFYRGKFYMFASFKNPDCHRRTIILKSDSPKGPFSPHCENLTPEDWDCLDGTLYVENGVPYAVFCHEWTQIHDGEMVSVKLKGDLSGTDGDYKILFRASQPFWAAEGSTDFVTDGPFLLRMESGKLLMLWSSLVGNNYVQAVSESDNGVEGPWTHLEPLFAKDGGHGMIFEDYGGSKYLVLHSPNQTGKEHPRLFPVCEINGALKVCD